MTEYNPDTLRAKASDRHVNGHLHWDDIAIYDAHADAWQAEVEAAQAREEAVFPWFLLKEAAMFVRREADLSGLVDARNMAYRLELALHRP